MPDPPAAVCTIATRTHGRYLVCKPEAGAAPAGLLVGFHGYGQSAADMLAELEQVPGARAWQCVSVQGLHRFYDRRQGRVVASWMTAEDRELAIADNVAYVAAVVAALGDASARGPLVYLGFSQGTAMAYRAAARAGHRCEAVIALGGDLPPDVRDDPAVALPRVIIGRGARDEYYAAGRFADDVAWLEERGRLAASIEFDGGHEFGDTFRAAAGALLQAIGGRE
jgi:predicted esterase